MNLDHARKVLDEIESTRPMIAPTLYGEPLLIPDFRSVVAELKQRALPIVINSNGLLLTEEIATFLCEQAVDSFMFSIDATTPETLKEVRGISKLDKIERNVHRLLKVRGEAEYPRVGVSYTVQDANRHELDAFVERWVGVVDVVRIGLVFDNDAGTFPEMDPGTERKACPALYTTLPIHNDGTGTMCCLDGFRATEVGNVFTDGVAGVWHGEAFSQIRYYHETGQWDKVPFCKNCNGWAEYDYEEEIRGNVMIRRSPQYVYYNKLSRLKNWKGRMLGGHRPPPENI